MPAPGSGDTPPAGDETTGEMSGKMSTDERSTREMSTGEMSTGEMSPVVTAPPRRRPGRRRAVVAGVTVVVVAGASVGVWLATRSTSSASPVTVTTETASVTTGTVKETVATSGTIDPGSEADLDFAVSGTVDAVDVTAGDKVTKGEVLARVDASALQAQLQAAEATLTAAQDTLSTDQADSASTSQVDSDEATVSSDETSVTSARDDVDDAALTSTITGTIASIDLTVGQQVSGSGSSSSASSAGASSSDDSAASASGTSGLSSSSDASDTSSGSSSSAQVTVIDTSSFEVAATVDDTEVGQVKVGDQAVITPGSSTSTVYGTVASVGLIASTSSDVATFPVVIAVTGTPSGLYAGASATVSIITKQLDDVVEVPTEAITYSGGNAEVTVVDGSRHVVTPITTGVTSGDETQVTKGVASGDKVLERVATFKGLGHGDKSLFGGTGTGTAGGGFRDGGGFDRGGAGGAGGFGGGGFGG